MTRAYEEIIDFIAGGSTLAAVADWVPSEASRERVVELIKREKAETLTAEELGELNHFMEIEHFMRLAKARARQRQGI